MTGNNQTNTGNGDGDVQEEDILAVYGTQDPVTNDLIHFTERKRNFAPWHHPVKQIVRDRQWATLTERLIRERISSGGPPQVLRYFTLPGQDLLDVKVLIEACTPFNVRIEYFGFNSATVGEEESGNTDTTTTGNAPWVMTESALRQAGHITSEAIIHPDRLEDIALNHSHAASQLRTRATFDVINIDACDHLAYAPAGRNHSTFDALQALLCHQMPAQKPWLLFLTTRVDPDLLGQPGINFQSAINQNLGVSQSGFGAALAECLDAEELKLATELNTTWRNHDTRFLKLYSVGLGKFLLQFFSGQPNLPANVELASVYAYRVHKDEPDMLALAFRIIPDGPRVYPPSVGGAAVIPNLEPARAVRVAQRAMRLCDIDDALEKEDDLREAAIAGTQKLLQGSNYDIDEWHKWLATHDKRPLIIGV
ncbi:PP_RS20740 family protein [Pusillimonas noertemannii]|uniref:Uncharacterized protein n=1 Tax=Pusillimonas noertemannii TaxID=305977 RepID=A0A2U1CMC8_9BURK|nr:hypothetical protein [Pusillimonas noertemannii]NYT68834.1 hypothetical protein [Pusillimonas noertemannii]PVY62142.1 hypothetical protein C7440_1634 [Pusillimonas noertemannii]TFL10868.1 hypothetical protein CSC72_10175 [Pusillimonas noertemannii]